MNYSFLDKYKVFLTGLLMAVLTSAYELFSTSGNPSLWVLGWSVGIAVLSYLANNLRGQVASILSIVLATSVAFFQNHGTGEDLNLREVATKEILPMLIAILGLFYTSPPKSRGYEHSAPIREAKREAKHLEPK
jgi:hypothetical protein